jgi:site-specific recombinase XerD
MVTSYLDSIPNLHPRTRCNRLLAIRQFCRFLFQSNSNTHIPNRNLIPSGKTSVRPYIFNETEIKALLEEALYLKPIGSLRPHAVATLIGLLWVSGIRIGEAVRLNLQDIDLDEGILHIRMTKFNKSRLVPISQSTRDALSNYLQLRSSFGHCQKRTAPVFINERSNRYQVQTADLNWTKLIQSLEIKTSQGKRPRLHDLRHSFATRWLSDFYLSGKDPSASLSVLATYLGHASVTSTELYLHPSLELLETAGQRFNTYVSKTREVPHEDK